MAVALVLASAACDHRSRARGDRPADRGPARRSAASVPGPVRRPAGSGDAQTLDFTARCSAPTTTTSTRIRRGIALTGPLRKAGGLRGLETGLDYTRRATSAVSAPRAGRPDQLSEAAAVHDVPGRGNFNPAFARTPVVGRRKLRLRARIPSRSVPQPDQRRTVRRPVRQRLATDHGMFRQNSYRSNTNVGVTQSLRNARRMLGVLFAVDRELQASERELRQSGRGRALQA